MSTEKQKTKSMSAEVFGSFFLCDHEFAISADYIQEVVHSPARLTELPLSPKYLLGLMNLRGTIVPVIDLQKLLHLPESTNLPDKKIAIVEQGGHCIGFLFDQTGEIFRSQQEERNDFSEDAKTAVIQGVFKKDEGKRLVQILNIPALFQLQGLPLQKDAISSRQRAKQRGLRKQCISFRVGPARCALGIHEIQEIIKIDKVSDTALSVDKCIGAFNLRGLTVPIIDFAAHLGYREPDHSLQATDGDRRVMILKIEKELFGLLVDAVDSIVAYHPEDLKPFPIIHNQRAEMFNSCLSLEGKEDILLLHYDKILQDKEILEITHGHSKLFQSENNKKQAAEAAGHRRTFITFSIDGKYAVRIDEVREIIEMPTELLNPPGLPAHCKGLFNHRGQIATVIDARSMYGRPQKKENLSEKIILFKKEESLFGLVVDSVEGILTFSDNHKIKLPESLYKQSTGPASDAIEAVQIKEPGQAKELTLFVLSMESLANRVLTERSVQQSA